MRIYSVHVPPLVSPVDRARVVAEGFSWVAFVLGVLWALWHRQWAAAAAILVAGMVLAGGLAAIGAGETTITIAAVAVNAIYGVVANDLRRRRYDRLGWREIGPIAADDADEALYKAAILHRDAAIRRDARGYDQGGRGPAPGAFGHAGGLGV